MNETRFDGRGAIVTGAGGRLGHTSAGAAVVVNDFGVARDDTGGSVAPAEAGGRAIADHHGVATVAGGEALVQAALERFGHTDVVIHNAGILRDRSFVKMTEEEWDAVIAVHLKGIYTVCRPAMREQRYGRIVPTSSGAGLFGNFGQANYAAAKTGQVGAMQVLNPGGDHRPRVDALRRAGHESRRDHPQQRTDGARTAVLMDADTATRRSSRGWPSTG